MQGQPFNYGETANLTSFGLDNTHFKFGILSFESDRYISVKEPSTVSGIFLLVSNSSKGRSRQFDYH